MKKTFVLYNVIVVILVIVVYLSISFTLSNYVNTRQTSYMLNVILDDTITAYNDTNLDDETFVFLFQNSAKRISILDSEGNPLADSMILSVGGNQSLYPEIQNVGSSYTRYSESLKMNLMYVAGYADNGNYVRVAIVMDQNNALNAQTILLLIVMSIGIIGLSYFSLVKTSETFMRPIQEIAQSVESIQKGNYKWAMPATQYDELNQLIREINHMNEAIVEQINTLETKEALLSILSHNMNQGIILIGSDKSIVFHNELALKWFNLDASEDLQYTIRHKDIYEAIQKATIQIISSNFRIQHEDSIISVRVNSVHDKLLVKREGNYGVLVQLVDETDRINLESNKRDFFANANHELRTPLTAIKGSAELMLYNMASPEEKIMLSNEIIKQVSMMDMLLKDMLELSRLETRNKQDNTSLNLKQILDQVVELLNPFIKEKSISVKISTENVLFNGLESDFRSLFKNLIENGIKYNKFEGSLEIALTQTDSNIYFKVKDSGIGIDKTQQNRIFERFYQVNKSRNAQYYGTGLGLAIVKHVLSFYKGEILVESKLGEGSQFTVKIPKNK